jgi:hypothetical protein
MNLLNLDSARVSFVILFAVATAGGCSSKGDGLGGTGGSGGAIQSGGAPGTGGLTQSGGAPGTGGMGQSGGAPGTGGADPAGLQAMLTAAEATWAAAKPSCPIYRYQSMVSSVFNSCSLTTYEIANDHLIRLSFVSYGSRTCYGSVTNQWDEVGAQLPDGGTVRTVEELFTECQRVVSEVAGSPSSYEAVGLAFNADGVPETCLATAIQCIDDCTDGIEIEGFTCEVSPSFDAGSNPG